MKYTLIGTAGHVDHGKTALIRALTGIETDRLAEEKSRGITIDLGFAHMTLPGGEVASIVDVPGHEKFIKNMLAGAGGIDLVLLVIAADDGIMPQTREHLGILQLLDAKDGIIVLTKCDLVDDEWRSMVADDIRQVVSDTFLHDAPMVHVSSHTGQGIDELKEIIRSKIVTATIKNIAAPFRIPVDRVFSAEGFGTVVTGTLIEGTMRQGDDIVVYPVGDTGRVRNLQIHGNKVEAAYAGQRVAVNISGLHRDEILRGHVLAPERTMQPTRMLDVKLTVLKDSPREMKTGTRLHFHYGTGTQLCKAQLIGVDKLLPGQTGYAQLRFAEEVAVKNGDTFVLRFYSPVETIGGGVVLNIAPKKHRKVRASAAIEALRALESGDTSTQVHQAIINMGGTAPLDELQKRFGLDDEAWAHTTSALVNTGRVTMLGQSYAMADIFQASLGVKIIGQLKTYHKENPLHSGMRKEELRSRVLPEHKPALFDEVLQLYSHELHIHNGRVALADFEVTYTPQQLSIRSAILDELKKGGFTPPPVDELISKDKKSAQKILDALISDGTVISTEPGIVFASATVDLAQASITRLAEGGDGTVTLAQFRDEIKASRKFALSLLEYFDRIGFTRKLGDSRVLR
ncbi:MAG: selenocysteine-specific translation elongation factor [Defluviitaleaceae bacterium]|nr:selenocysteine-specific translation elongation factor [Defluviitaleaceae bacterium]